MRRVARTDSFEELRAWEAEVDQTLSFEADRPFEAEEDRSFVAEEDLPSDTEDLFDDSFDSSEGRAEVDEVDAMEKIEAYLGQDSLHPSLAARDALEVPVASEDRKHGHSAGIDASASQTCRS